MSINDNNNFLNISTDVREYIYIYNKIIVFDK